MAKVTIEALWKQLSRSGLLGPTRMVEVARRFQNFAANGGTSLEPTAAELASWLVEQEIVSREQCDVLLRRIASPAAPPPFSPSKQPENATPQEDAPSASTIVADDSRRPSRRMAERGNLTGKKTLWISACSLAAVALIVTLAFSLGGGNDTPTGDEAIAETPLDTSAPGAIAPALETDAAAISPKKDEEKQRAATPPREIAMPDDGQTLWASPTAGLPPTLRHVPSGTQVVCTLRPQELLTAGYGKALLAGLGPAGDEWQQWIEAASGHDLQEIRRLDIMLGESDRMSPLLAVVVYPKSPLDENLVEGGIIDNEQAEGKEARKSWQQARQAALAETQPVQPPLVYFFPDRDRMVLAPREVIDELQAADTGGAPLVHPLSELNDRVDRDRHINILFSSDYLQSEREKLYGQRLAPMRESITWMLGPDSGIQGGVLSLHLEERLFAELQIFTLREVLPRIAAREFHKRIDQSPRRAKDHLKTLSIHSYSRDVLWDFPEMLRSVAHYTRHDRDGRFGVVRCYLPASAAAHLASAIDLTLWETARARAGDTSTGPSTTIARRKRTLEERLGEKTSLSFDRSSLEKSLQMLSEDVGIRIVILGSDLQLEGITKNQSFGLDMRDRSIRKILNAIVQQANPDKTATELSDPAQKLVYILKEKFKGGDDAIVITTRAQAAARRDTLPEEFVNLTENTPIPNP